MKIIKSDMIDVMDYCRHYKINPADVYYEQINAQNPQVTQLVFQNHISDTQANLLSFAHIEVLMSLSKTLSDGSAENYDVSDRISLKPGCALARSCDNIKHTINSDQYVLNEPGAFEEQLNIAYSNKKTHGREFQSKLLNLDAVSINLANYGSSIQSQFQYDQGQWANENAFVMDGNDENADDFLSSNVMNFKITEPLVGGLFNPYLDDLDNHPESSLFKHMSPVIPNISTLGIRYNLASNLAARMFHYRIGVTTSGTNLTPSIDVTAITQARLFLYYYRPRTPKLLKQPELRFWDVIEYPTVIGSVANDASIQAVSPSIDAQNVPGLMMISVKRDFTGASYDSTPFGYYNTTTVAQNHLLTNSFDEYMSIDSIEIVLKTRPTVVSTFITRDELMELTLRNCNKYFHYDREIFWGGEGIKANTSVGNRSGKCFILLNMAQINEFLPQGTKELQNYKIKVNATMNVGHPKITNSNISSYVQEWTMYVHLFNSNMIRTIERGRAAYREDEISKVEGMKAFDHAL